MPPFELIASEAVHFAPGSGTPQISVLIVAYKCEALLGACVTALHVALGDRPYEVIVVDNSPPPEDVPPVAVTRRIRNLTNCGFAAAVNQAAQAALGDCLVILNPDTVPEVGSLGQLVDAVRSGCVAAGPLLLDRNGGAAVSARPAVNFTGQLFEGLFLHLLWPANSLVAISARTALPIRVDCLSGACFAISRRDFIKFGGFDETFFLYGEDVDFFERLRLSGARVEFVPTARVLHHQGGSVLQDPALFIRELHRSRARILHRRFSGWRLMFLRIAQQSGLLGIAALCRAAPLLRGRDREWPKAQHFVEAARVAREVRDHSYETLGQLPARTSLRLTVGDSAAA